jgi:hypothetical protein
MKQPQPSRTGTMFVLAALAALGILLALAGCTLVGESLTGVELKDEGPTSCVKDCNDAYKALYEEEQKLHDSNVEACQALDQPDKVDCLTAETARHEAAKTSLASGKVECQNDCHRQGAGTAG